jgi:hypothetical protein
MRADLLANVERPPAEQPCALAPPVPDLESATSPRLGSVHSQIERWRVRAVAAERELAELRGRIVGSHRFRP